MGRFTSSQMHSTALFMHFAQNAEIFRKIKAKKVGIRLGIFQKVMCALPHDINSICIEIPHSSWLELLSNLDASALIPKVGVARLLTERALDLTVNDPFWK